MAITQAKRDIVVVGGGIVGASTSYFLSRHPLFNAETMRITILEASQVAAAASGKSGGFLALDWHGKDTTPLSALSFQLHKDLASEHRGAEKWGYRALEAVSLQVDLCSLSSKGGSGVVSANKSHKGLHGWLGPNVVGGMKTRSLGTEKTCAQVHPRLLTEELVRLSGAEVVISTAVSLTLDPTTKRPKSVGVAVTSSSTETEREIPATDVVLAAGPWIGDLAIKLLGPRIGGTLAVSGSRAHSIVLRTLEDVIVTPHALFTSLTLEDGSAGDPECYPRPDGTTYICGATDDESLPPASSPVIPSPSAIQILRRQADALSPHFARASVVAEQACYLPISDRGRPLIGAVRGVEGVYIGGGLSCWGITQGPGTGKVLAELILGGEVSSANVSRLAP